MFGFRASSFSIEPEWSGSVWFIIKASIFEISTMLFILLIYSSKKEACTVSISIFFSPVIRKAL